MCGYFCIEFINFMFNGNIGFINFMFNRKSLTDYTNLFSPSDLKKTMI